MRNVDRYAGSLLVNFLSGFFYNIKYQNLIIKDGISSNEFILGEYSCNVPKGNKRVIMIKFFGIGSIINSLPLCNSLKRETYRIGYLTFKSNSLFLRNINIIDEVFEIDNSDLLRFFISTINVLLKIWKYRPNIAIDLEFYSNFSQIFSIISGARVRIGFFTNRLSKGNLLTHRIHFNHYRHIRSQYSAIFKIFASYNNVQEINYDETILSTGFVMKLSEIPSFCMLTRNEYYVININSSDVCLERRWPIDYYKDLINYMMDNHEGCVALIGGSSEINYVDSLVQCFNKKIDRLLNFAGKTSINELFSLINYCKLLITNDSGPAHIAEFLGVPSIIFFGPETPQLYGNLRNNSVNLYKNIGCSPCLNAYNGKKAICKGNNLCLKQIRHEEVFGPIKKLSKGK